MSNERERPRDRRKASVSGETIHLLDPWPDGRLSSRRLLRGLFDGGDILAPSQEELTGSWFVALSPEPGAPAPGAPHYVGVMRISSRSGDLRISGDFYDAHGKQVPGSWRPSRSEAIGALQTRGGYPRFPHEDYAFHLKGLRVTWGSDAMIVEVRRVPWDEDAGGPGELKFREDLGWTGMIICARRGAPSLTLEAPAVDEGILGRARLGPDDRWGFVFWAVKTSPYVRGCQLEVDVMAGEAFVGDAADCDDEEHSLHGVFRKAGLDLQVIPPAETDLVDSAGEEDSLLEAELFSLLREHFDSGGGSSWHLWLLIGTRSGNYSVLGWMFDLAYDVDEGEHAAAREGAVVFHDFQLDKDWFALDTDVVADDTPLGDAPLVALRVAAHELGHAFNLSHPTPTENHIMGPTQSVALRMSPSSSFPCGVEMTFSSADVERLCHAPDPCVAPAWVDFEAAGAFDGVDAWTRRLAAPPAPGLRLALHPPKDVHVGAFLSLGLRLVNESACVVEVPNALDLACGVLHLRVRRPDGRRVPLRSVFRAEALIYRSRLDPGEWLETEIQLFFTARGRVFDQPGDYSVEAALEMGDPAGAVVRSGDVSMRVRSPRSQAEREVNRITKTPGVGPAFALGDFGLDDGARRALEELAGRHGETVTGKAAALTLSNALSRTFRDARTRAVLRDAAPRKARGWLDAAVATSSPVDVMRAAVAIASTLEGSAAPLPHAVLDRYKHDNSVSEPERATIDRLYETFTRRP